MHDEDAALKKCLCSCRVAGTHTPLLHVEPFRRAFTPLPPTPPNKKTPGLFTQAFP
jgi:hypothetical protein